jgi:predicted benzoate:H+ symporter BenE
VIGRVAGGPYVGTVMVSALPAAGGAVLLRVEHSRRFTSMEAVLACLGHRLVLWRTGRYVSFSCVVKRFPGLGAEEAFCGVLFRFCAARALVARRRPAGRDCVVHHA